MSIIAYQIHELLSTLDPTEKSYVKKTFSANEKNMSQLFDDLNKFEQFDKKSFLKRYNKRSYMKYLSQNCNYLFKRITKSLIDYNTENLTEINIMSRLSFISLMVKKGMFSSCLQKIDKEIELTETFEYYEYGYKLIKLKERFYKIYLIKEFSYQEYRALAEKKKLYIQQLQFIDELDLLRVTVSSNELENLEKVKLVQSKFAELNLNTEQQICQLPLLAKQAYNYINYKVSQFEGKPNLTYLERSLSYYNEKAFLKPIYYENYLLCISNYLIGLIVERNFNLFFDEHEKYVKELKSYAKWKTMKTSPFYHIIEYYLFIVSCIKSNKVDAAVKKAKQYLLIIKQNFNKLTSYFKYDAISNIAMAFFNAGYMDKTLDALELLKEHVSIETQYFYRIMQIVCHYKLNNILLVDSLSISFANYLRKHNETARLRDFLTLKQHLLDINSNDPPKFAYLPYLKQTPQLLQ